MRAKIFKKWQPTIAVTVELQEHNHKQHETYQLSSQQQAKQTFYDALNVFTDSLSKQALNKEQKNQFIDEFTIKWFCSTPQANVLSQQLKDSCMHFIHSFDKVAALAKKQHKKYKFFASSKSTDLLFLLEQSITPLMEIVKELVAHFGLFTGDSQQGNDTLLPLCIETLKGAELDYALLANFSHKLLYEFYQLAETLKDLCQAESSLANSLSYACSVNVATAASVILEETYQSVLEDWTVAPETELDLTP